MSLLRDIQDNAIGNGTSVEVLLHQRLVLGARLHLKPLTEWAHLELNGYPDDVPRPAYRPRIHTQVLADVAGPFGSGGKNVPLASTSIPDDFEFVKDHLFWTDIRQKVPEIEALVATGQTEFQIPWPQEILAPLQRVFFQDMIVVAARQIVPSTVYSSTWSGIKERVLQFALDIEVENPDAGEARPDEEPVAEPKATQIFHQNFFGDYATVGNAGRDVNQDIHEAVETEGLLAALRGLGVPEHDQTALVKAVREDEETGTFPGLKTRAWLATLERGGVSLGSGITVGVAVDLVSKVLGIG